MKILKKINYLQLLFHSIAAWFLLLSFNKFTWLHNLKIIEMSAKYGAKYTFDHHEKLGITLYDMTLFNFWPEVASLAGFLVAIIISLIVSKIKGWPIINSLIVFAAILILFRFGISPHSFSFLSLNKFLDNYQVDFIILGSFFLFCSLFVFFSKYLNGFINKHYLKQERE